MGRPNLLRLLESVWALERRVAALLVDYKLTLSQFRLLWLLEQIGYGPARLAYPSPAAASRVPT